MRRLFVALAALTLPVSAALAQDAKPTEASVRYLFQVMHTSQLLDAATSQMDANMRETFAQASKGQTLNAQQQQIQDEARAKIVAVMKGELDWSRMEPKMVEVYRNSFTPEEIAGMLKFYDSPVGRSVIVKQPQATAQLMQLVHEDMRTVIPQIVQIQQDAGARIRAAGESSPASEPAPH